MVSAPRRKTLISRTNNQTRGFACNSCGEISPKGVIRLRPGFKCRKETRLASIFLQSQAAKQPTTEVGESQALRSLSRSFGSPSHPPRPLPATPEAGFRHVCGTVPVKRMVDAAPQIGVRTVAAFFSRLSFSQSHMSKGCEYKDPQAESRASQGSGSGAMRRSLTCL
jgi:hypothetical protein